MAQPAVTEARDLANYAFLALLIFGVLMALSGFWLFVYGAWYFFGPWLIFGVVLLAIGGFGAFTALTVWKPKIIDAMNQGRYAEAYRVASDPIQLVIGIICIVIPGILLYLTQQKLASIVGPTPPPPPPPPP